MGAVVYLTFLGTAPLEIIEVQTEYLDYFTRKWDHASEMLFTRQKAILGANPESPARTQPGTNICEVINPGRPVFTQEYNDLFIQQVLQYSQENESN